MTALETQSSRELFKSSGGDTPGLRSVRNNRFRTHVFYCTHVLYYTVCRQRRDKEQMVSDYSNVTDNLTAISRSVVVQPFVYNYTVQYNQFYICIVHLYCTSVLYICTVHL